MPFIFTLYDIHHDAVTDTDTGFLGCEIKTVVSDCLMTYSEHVYDQKMTNKHVLAEILEQKFSYDVHLKSPTGGLSLH